MAVAQRTGAVRVRNGPRDPKLREARVCYDHLAGERGVAMLEGLTAHGHLTQDDRPAITETGREFFAGLGLGLGIRALEKARRPVCRRCLDWSERRAHLGGSLGAGLLDWMTREGWLRREPGRVLLFSRQGLEAFDRLFAFDRVFAVR